MKVKMIKLAITTTSVLTVIAAGLSSASANDFMTEGIPHPSAAINNTFKVDSSTPCVEDMMGEGITFCEKKKTQQNFAGDPSIPSGEEIMAEGSSTRPSDSFFSMLWANL